MVETLDLSCILGRRCNAVLKVVRHGKSNRVLNGVPVNSTNTEGYC